MNQDSKQNADNLISSEDLRRLLYDIIAESPVGTIVTDKNGTMVFINDAGLKLFGIANGDALIGRYNIIDDEALQNQDIYPHIKRILVEGGSYQAIIDYDLSLIKEIKIDNPKHIITCSSIFAVIDTSGSVNNLIIQHFDVTDNIKITDDLPVWVWESDTSGIIVYSNYAAEDLLGYTRHELIGKYIYDLIVPEDKEYVQRSFKEASENQADINNLESRMVHKNGSIVCISTNAKPILHDICKFAGYKGININISKRKQVEAELRSNEVTLKLFIEHAPAAIAMFDNHMRYMLYSKRWLHDYNLGDQDIAGRTHYEVFPEISERWKELHQRALHGEVLTCEEDPFPRVDGTLDWVRWEIRPWYNSTGNVGGIIMLTEVITNRKRWEETLKTSEEKFRSLVSNIPDVVWSKDSNGNMSFIAPNIKNLSGYTSEEICNSDITLWLGSIHPDDVAHVKSAFDMLFTSPDWVYDVEYRLRTRDGQWIWVHDRSTCTYERDGIKYADGVMSDITDRKNTENALHESEARLRALIENLPFDFWANDEEGRYTMQNSVCIKHWGNLIGLNPEVLNYPQYIKDLWISNNNRALTGEVVKGEAEYAFDVEKVTNYNIISPVRTNDKITGIVGINIDITEMKRVEEALKKERNKAKTYLDIVGVIMIVIDKDLTVSLINKKGREMLGCSEEEIIGKNWIENFIPVNIRSNVKDVFQALMQGNVESIEYYENPILTCSGEERLIAWHNTILRDESGNVTSALASGQDITEQRRAENELRDSEEKFRMLFDNANDAILLSVLSGTGTTRKFIAANAVALRRLGYSLDELLSMSPEDISPPERLDELKHIYDALNTDRRVTWEWEHVAKDKRIIPVEISSHMFTMKGRQVVISVARDITERKQAEDALKESQQKLMDIINFLPDATVVADKDGRIIAWNLAMEEMTGVKAEDILNKADYSVGSAIYGVKRPALIDLIFKPEKELEKYYSFIKRDNGVLTAETYVESRDIYIWGRTRPLYDSHGNLVGAIESVRDITERKRYEEAIMASEQNFKSLFEYIPAAVFGYNRDGIIIQVNPTFEQTFRYTSDEIIGKSMFDTIVRPENKDSTQEIINKVFSGEVIRNIEWNDIKNDGTYVWVLTNTTPVRDANGKIIMGISLNIDITERKQAEQREKELENHKRDFYRRTILAATEGKLEITERQDIKRIAGPSIYKQQIIYGEDLSIIRNQVAEIVDPAGMDESRIYDFILAIGEATTNAYKHAGGGTTSLHRTPDGFIFVVSDRGPGIDALTLPEVALTRGFSTAGTLGMGYKAILAIADKTYLSTGPSGTTVAIEMKLHSEVPRNPTFAVGNWTL
ncbi:MAG: PAS domain S-box protein [Armatimonadota bacterium]